MALQPRPRRRAINVETEAPVVPVYETKAREYVRANKSKNEQAKIEKAAHADVWKAMNQATPPVGSFEITEGNTVYDAVIAGTTENEISVVKLYALVQENQITMEQFLKTVSATQANVTKVLGKNILNKVLLSTPGEAKLTIKERKGS